MDRVDPIDLIDSVDKAAPRTGRRRLEERRERETRLVQFLHSTLTPQPVITIAPRARRTGRLPNAKPKKKELGGWLPRGVAAVADLPWATDMSRLAALPSLVGALGSDGKKGNNVRKGGSYRA